MDAINRTFVGVRVPGPLLSQIDEKLLTIKRKPGVDNIRWNGHSELLLNLVSLGELGVGTLASLKPVLRDVASRFPRLSLEIKGFGGLPNMIQPRYCYAGIDGPDAHWLPQLAQQIDQATRTLTPHRDTKEFHAHILLGRLKTENEQYRVALGRALKLMEQPSMGAWQVDNIELLISSASESGIGYTVVDLIPLGG
jgi:2'-5' RNA ligase